MTVKENRSYTDLRNAVKPPRKPGKAKAKKPRPLARALQINYDLLNENKLMVHSPVAIPKKKAKRLLKEKFDSNGPIYIGQNVYIRPSYIVSLPEYINVSTARSASQVLNEKNLSDNAHKGNLSCKGINKLKNAINWLLCQAKEKPVFHKEKNAWFKFKVNFITLTLPDTAREIKDDVFKETLVAPFLAYMRKYYSLKHYVWKLEFQQNGKLHLHLVTDTFLHYAKIRSVWNTILGHNNMLTDFYAKFGHADPNSTDVHSVKKIKNLAGYLAKYMSKQSADLVKIKGRIWGCSESLSRANTTRVFIDRDACHMMLKPLLNCRLNYKPITSFNPTTKIEKKIGEVVFLNYRDWLTIMQGTIKHVFTDTISFLQNTSQNELLTYEV